MEQEVLTHFYVCIVRQESACGSFVCRLMSASPIKDEDIMSVLMAKARATDWDEDVPVICDIVEFDDGDAAQEFYDSRKGDARPATPQEMAAFVNEMRQLSSFAPITPVMANRKLH